MKSEILSRLVSSPPNLSTTTIVSLDERGYPDTKRVEKFQLKLLGTVRIFEESQSLQVLPINHRNKECRGALKWAPTVTENRFLRRVCVSLHCAAILAITALSSPSPPTTVLVHLQVPTIPRLPFDSAGHTERTQIPGQFRRFCVFGLFGSYSLLQGRPWMVFLHLICGTKAPHQ